MLAGSALPTPEKPFGGPDFEEVFQVAVSCDSGWSSSIHLSKNIFKKW